MDTPLSSDLGSGWHCQMAGRLANCSWLDVLLTDWPSNKMLTWPSPRMWLRVWLTFCQMTCCLAGWLAGHLTKCYLCIDVKDGHSLMIWFRVKLTFCQMAGWLANCCWLGVLLTDWPPNKVLNWPSRRIWLWVRLTFCQMACWLAWLAGHLTNYHLTYLHL